MTRWIDRLLSSVVPREWRDTVQADLDDESRGGRRSVAWRYGHLLRAGLRLRLGAAGLLDRPVGGYMRVTVISVILGLVAASVSATSPDQLPMRSATDGMWLMRPVDPKTGENYGMIPGAFVRAARARLDGLADMAVFGMATERLSLPAAPDDKRSLSVSEMTPGALRVVGIPPIIGREFSDSDLRDGAAAVALVTYQVWQGRFGGRPDAIGDRLWRGASGHPREPVIIIGVLPRDFFTRVPVADSRAEAFLPSRVFVNRVVDSSFAPLLRLRPGVAIDKVRADVNQAVDSVRGQVGDPVGKLNARLDPADRPGWMK